MRQFAMIALLSLAACGPTKQDVTSQCELSALDHYSGQPVTRLQLIADYEETCMLAHGYRFDGSLPGCTASGVSELVIPGEAMCYRAHSGRP
jgi:hypothetical protein